MPREMTEGQGPKSKVWSLESRVSSLQTQDERRQTPYQKPVVVTIDNELLEQVLGSSLSCTAFGGGVKC